MIHVDLVPQSIREARARRRRVRGWTRGIAAYAALLAGGVAVLHMPLDTASPKLESELRRLDEAAARASADRVRLAALVNDKRRRLDAARAVGEHPDWSLLLLALADARGGRVALDTVALSLTTADVSVTRPSGGETRRYAPPQRAPRVTHVLSIGGHAESPGQVFEFARQIELLGVMDQVSVVNTSSASLGALATTRFEIRATLAEPTEVAP